MAAAPPVASVYPAQPRGSASSERVVIFGTGLVLLLLGIGGFGLQQTVTRLADDAEDAVRTQDAITHLVATLSALTDVETGVRGYLITGDEEYLHPFTTGREKLLAEHAALARLADDGTLAGESVATLVSLSTQRMQIAETLLSDVRTGGADAARERLAVERGKALHDRIRTVIDAEIADNSEELRLRRAATHEAMLTARWVAAVTTVASLCVAVAAVVIIRHDLRRRRETVRALEGMAAALAAARDQALSADRMKSGFLATMSHELRTPLNSILGFTGVMLQGLAGPLNEEQQRQLGMVQNSSRNLLRLINDLLDLSRIEAGELRLDRVEFDMAEPLAQVAESLRPLAAAKGLTLDCAAPAEPLRVASDRRRVEQILLNLAGNAIKFTDCGGVRLAVAGDADTVMVDIRDTGPGMSAEEVAGLFRPFHQVRGGIDRRHEGSGLGLAISRELTELLGGEILVRSTPGSGTTFTLRLPRVAEQT